MAQASLISEVKQGQQGGETSQEAQAMASHLLKDGHPPAVAGQHRETRGCWGLFQHCLRRQRRRQNSVLCFVILSIYAPQWC